MDKLCLMNLYNAFANFLKALLRSMLIILAFLIEEALYFVESKSSNWS